jgi:hypothetical protein
VKRIALIASLALGLTGSLASPAAASTIRASIQSNDGHVSLTVVPERKKLKRVAALNKTHHELALKRRILGSVRLSGAFPR